MVVIVVTNWRAAIRCMSSDEVIAEPVQAALESAPSMLVAVVMGAFGWSRSFKAGSMAASQLVFAFSATVLARRERRN